ncbi:MAG: alpha/beta fold hydrolase [Thermoleophilia bacterium]|nr:alpha/beta fold hydrolase [Thermoleophilia bacterium]
MTQVFLLHALGADRRAFQRFERLLPDTWQVESLDLLGHGEAPKPATGYALADHATYVLEQVAQRDAPDPVLVGHSYGAATSVAAAALQPERVRGIVLLDPVVRISDDVVGGNTARMVRARREGTLQETVAAIYPDASEALRAWTVQTWEAMALGVVDELDGDWTRYADRVTCPTAIIHGDEELGGAGDLAADWFDDPEVVRIAGSGHYLHATHARETAAAVVAAVAGFTAT